MMTYLFTTLSNIKKMRHILLVSLVLLMSPSTANAAALCGNLTNSRLAIADNIINCVEGKFRASISTLSNAISGYMTPVQYEMFLLAIIFFGLKIFGGGGGWPVALGFFTRIAAITFFLANMDKFGDYMFDMQKELVNAVVEEGPWKKVDVFMGRMLGYGATFTIANGLIGVLAGAMFSSAFGLALFFFGIKAILDLVFFVIQAMFVHLTAVMVLAFMIAISPLIIPFGIFSYTEKYVVSWGKIVVASIITPMFLMMAMTAFINPIDRSVQAVFHTLGSKPSKPDFAVFLRSQESSSSWLLPSDADANQFNKSATSAALQNPAISSNSNPAMRYGFNSSAFDSPGVNFGLNSIGVVKELLIEFAKIIVMTYLVKSLVEQMPSVAAGIAGGGHNVFRMQQTGAERAVKSQVAKIEQQVTRGGGNG